MSLSPAANPWAGFFSAMKGAWMGRSWLLGASLFAWVGVWAFWLTTTHSFHPTFTLALIVTTSLVVAYAVASYMNHYILLPRFWSAARRWHYAVWLITTMALLTACALAVIRVSYLWSWGPDADPNGVYKHYAIDLFGMAVHVGVAAFVVWVTDWFVLRHRGTTQNSEDEPR